MKSPATATTQAVAMSWKVYPRRVVDWRKTSGKGDKGGWRSTAHVVAIQPESQCPAGTRQGIRDLANFCGGHAAT